MIDLLDVLLLMLFATACAWLWRGHGIRERALALAKQHCAKLDVELLDGNVAFRRLALLRDSRGNRRDIVLEARLSIEDFEIRKLAALQGLGMTMLPQMNCQQELEAGTLVRLLPGWELPGGNLQAVYTHRRGMLPAVRAWIEHLTEACQAEGLLPI